MFTFWVNLYSRHFLKEVDETFGDLPGVTGIADNIVVYGYDDRDHDKNLSAVLQHARETGLHSASSSVPVFHSSVT